MALKTGRPGKLPLSENTGGQMKRTARLLVQLALVFQVNLFGKCASDEANEARINLRSVTEIEQVPLNLQHRQCQQPLGLESGDIKDDQILVSASLAGKYNGKENARLNSDHAWVTHTFPEPWIEVNLREPKLVSGVRTQGKALLYSGNYWISTYQVCYKLSVRDLHWRTLSHGVGSHPYLFKANADSTNIVTNIFPQPIQAQIIKIVPKSWPQLKNKIALRMELLGCPLAADSGCGGPRVLTNSTGYLSSMNYPNNYSNNANCVWEIMAPPEQTIVLQFERFQLEAGFNNCRLEYVEVIDIIGELEKSLGKMCGRATPKKFLSTDNQLKIQFLSDHFEYDVGFRARYHFVNGSKCGRPQALTDSGQFQTINYPENYENNMRCIWDITVDPNKLVEISFQDMRIAGQLLYHGRSKPICTEDNVKIINNKSGFNNHHSSQYCGYTLPPVFVSTSNMVKVIFESNGQRTDRGFLATYKSVIPSLCGGKRDLTALSGEIQSLNYPKVYKKNLQCEWRISTKKNADIKITFHDFDLEEDNDCRYDYVSIYDGGKLHLLGKYCGNLTIHPLVAHSGEMTVVFHSDDINNHKGFYATYVINHHTTQQPTTMAPTKYLQDTTSPIEVPRLTSPKSMIKTPISTTVISTEQNKMTSNEHQSTTTQHLKTKTTKIDNSIPKIPNDTVVTKEMAKWIIVGLVAVSAVLLILVLFGIMLCCREHMSGNSIINQGSFRNANNSRSLPVASTNQSIRSRQIEQPESSQVSESFSHQGTLRKAPSTESHIYFSIPEYCNRRKKVEAPNHANSKTCDQPNVHYKKQFMEASLVGGSDLSGGMPSEEEIDDDDYAYEVGDDYNVLHKDYNHVPQTRSPKTSATERSSVSFQNNEKTKTLPAGSKVMVNNILYESADSMDQDG